MIVQEAGRWRSYPTPEEKDSEIEEVLSKLNEEELASLEAILGEVGSSGKSQIADTCVELEWEEIPIPIEEWLESYHHIGDLKDSIYPVLKKDMIELFNGNYHEVILCLHPSTRIPLPDGTTPTIKQLATHWARQETPFLVYSLVDGEFALAEAYQPRQTGEDDYYKVTLVDGSSFVSNARHQMIMSNGQKRMVKDMSIGDRIMPFDVEPVLHGTKVISTTGKIIPPRFSASRDPQGKDYDFSPLKERARKRAVSSIEKIGHGPVFCMTVPSSGNFAISTHYNNEEVSNPYSRGGVISSNTGSTRWGKDFFSTTCMVRLLYELYCLRNPAQSMGLGAGESVHVVPISRTTQQARRIVFGGIASKLSLAPWWKGKYKETLDYIEIKDKKITIVGGASGEAAALGLNVYTALIDEGNFMGAVKASDAVKSAAGVTYDRAQMICDGMVRRIQSTYRHAGVRGMLFLISSKRATDDFTERRIRDHIKNKTTTGVFVRDYATWHVRPEPFKNQKWYRCAVSAAEGRCRILEDGEKGPEDAVVFEFPEDFLLEFKRDPAGSTRDIAGIATDAYAPFIANRRAIERMFDKHRPQVFATREWDMATGKLDINWNDVTSLSAKGERVPICCPGAQRHVHIDLSRNMCATGFNLCHQGGVVEVLRTDPTGKKMIEEAPIFHIDGIVRIIAGAANEIDHSEVRALIYRLNDGGLNVRSVSMDHWMSVPNMQLLKRHGFRVDEISTVKKIDPYDTARSALYEGRIVCPPHPLLAEELRALELDPRRPDWRPKVIVQPGYTKDLADAWAGGIYYLNKNARSGVPLDISRGVTVSSTPDRQYYWKNGDVIFADERGYDNSQPDRKEGGDRDEYDQLWIIT